MKTLICKALCLLCTIGCPVLMHSQIITTTASSMTSCPGEIIAPLTVTGFSGVAGYSMVLTFSQTVLGFVNYQNLQPDLASGDFTVNSFGNSVYIAWSSTNAVTLPGGSTLFELNFSGTPGTSTLSWNTQTPGNCEYVNINGQGIASTWVGGTITVNQPPLISVHPQNRTIAAGSSTTISITAIATGITYQWQMSLNGGSSWSDLSNGGYYSNVTTSALNISAAVLGMNGYHYRCKVLGTCLPVAFSNAALLTVTPLIITTCQTVSGCPGEIIVQVTANDFIGVASYSMVLGYNTSILTYAGYQNLNPALNPANFTVSPSGGNIYLTWYDNPAVTLSNGSVVYELKFTGIPGSSALTWNQQSPGNCEYADITGLVIFSNWNNGHITVYQPPVISIHPLNKTIAAGSGTTFSVTANATGIGYQWQVSTNGGSSWSDLSNGGSYSNVTTSTLNIADAVLGMNGYRYRCKVSGTCQPVALSYAALLTVTPLIITTCQTLTSCPGEVLISVSAVDFIGVASFSMVLGYNASVLTHLDYQDLNPGLNPSNFAASASGGYVYLTWYNNTAVTLSSGATLYKLKFTGVPGTGALTWNNSVPGNCEYTDITGLVIFSNWNNGMATITQPPLITGQPVNRTVSAGESTTFSVTATGAGLTYLWQKSINGGTSWSDLSNSSPYSGVTTATLSINPADTSMDGNQYRCRISGTCPPVAYTSQAILTVTPAPVTTSLTTITNSCTRNLNIPVNVTNANNLGSISLVLIYDTTKMSFEGYHSPNGELSKGMLVVNRNKNKVYLNWLFTSGPANIGTGILIKYHFKANSGISSALTWDNQTPGNCEFTDVNGTIISSSCNNATVSVISNALLVNAGDDVTIVPENSTQLNGSASGGVSPYTYSWNPSTWLTNPSISNPVANPQYTTLYTLTVTGNNGCSGPDMVQVTVQYPLPVVTTDVVSGITDSSATCGGNVTGDGGTSVVARGVCWSAATPPTILDNYTTDGTGTGQFISEFTGLNASTTYYVRAYATTVAGTGYGDQVAFTTNAEVMVFPCPGMPTVIYEGKTYNTVQIGNQCWLRENLDVGTRINGTQEQANNNVIEKYCQGNVEANCDMYGGLYQWGEMVKYLFGASNTSSWNPVPAGYVRGICPQGWHIPGDQEWDQLAGYLGGNTVAGGKMKETGTLHWMFNMGATNSSGFTGLPGGYRYYNGDLSYMHYYGLFWSASESSSQNAWCRRLNYDDATLLREYNVKPYGFSVRCIKDTCTSYSEVNVSIGVSANPVCAGTSVTFDATPVNGGTNPYYSWLVNGVRTGSNNSIFTYTPSNGDNISCVLISSLNCVTSNPDTSNHIIMTVSSRPVATITGSDSLCTGIPATYYTQGGMTGYQWTVTGNPWIMSGGASGDSTITLTWNTQGNWQISVTYTDGNGCQPVAHANLGVFVEKSDTVAVSINASATTVCSGDTVCFTATSTIGGSNPYYKWVVNGININEGLIAYYPFNGNANDESGNGNDGTTGGDFQYINGIAGKSLHVTSHSSGYSCDNDLGGNVTLPNLQFTSMTSFSYSLWVKDEGITCGAAAYIYFRDDPNSNPYAGIMRSGNSIHFMAGLNNANDIIVAPYLSSYSSSFVNYCLVYDNGTTTAYINGNLVESKLQPANVDGTHSAIARSWYSDRTSTRLTGAIDQVRIYDRPLSSLEVQQLYHEGNPEFCYVPSNNDTIYCILTSPSGCAINNPDTSNRIIITVNPSPPAPVSGGDKAVCSNTLPAILSVDPGSGNTADWYQDPSGGNPVETNSSTYTTSNAGTYYAEARNNATGCVNSVRTAVTLTVIPAINKYYRDSDGDGHGNPAVYMLDCDPPDGYVTSSDDCNDADPLVYPGAQHIEFTGNPGFENSIVSPPTGTPYTFFYFQADYFDLSGELPAQGYPKLILDYEGNGIYTDPYDRTIIMTEDNPNDLNTVDGKRYIASINGLTYGTGYKVRIISSDGASCFTTLGPFNAPDIIHGPNVYLFANDITFSNSHPDPSQNIIVYAVIHNESDLPAENFIAHLVNQADPGANYPDVTVTYLPPHESQTVQWLITTPSLPAWCPMQVKIDYTNVILETNELDNSAIRPFLNGDFQLPGGINCIGYVSPYEVCAGKTTTLYGSAVYYGTAVPLPDYSVAGATVEFQVQGTTISGSGYTDSHGNFAINFPTPLYSGTYQISGTVTDYTLTGTFTAEFKTKDCPPIPLPDLVISCLNLPPYCVEPGTSVSGSVTVTNIGQAPAGSSYITFSQTGGSPALPAILAPPLGVNESYTAAIGPVLFNQEGDFVICATADGTYLVAESNEDNNTTCTTVHVDSCWDLPDIVPVEGPSNSILDCFLPSATSFKIYNTGCIPTGPFTSEIIVTPPTGPVSTFTISVPGIGGKSFYSFSIPYIYESLGLYCFEIRCDIPTETGGVVEECREYNNVATYCRVICACKPNLTMYWCTSLDVQPENVQYPGTAQLIAGVKNTGLVPVPPPIKVRFWYIPGGETFDAQSNETLEPGQTVAISAIAPVPPPATTLLCAYADPDNEIEETNETDNGACDSMCYEFHPVGFYSYCGTNFWEYTYQKNQTISLWTGLFVEHLYRAGPVKVKFEVSGPGISGTQDLGYGLLQHVAKICYGCPYSVMLPTPFTFPDCGTYTFTMTADPDNDYPECNETNNVISVNVLAICIEDEPCCKPNLTFPSCKGIEVRPVNPLYPDDCQLVAHVQNNGNSPANPPVVVEFTYNTGGQYFGYCWNPIQPGETVEITASAPLPPPATTVLTACIDPADIIDEWNEYDNCTSESMCWEFQPVPQCGPHFWDHCYMVGQSLYFSIGVAVSHLYDASPVKVKFEVMGPGIQGKQTAGYGYLGYATRLCYYCPAVVVSQMPYTFFEAGIYTVIITVDPDNIYTECNENNNVFEVNVCVNDYLPDMRVLSQFINPSLLNPDPGEPVTFLMSYENIGASNIGDNMAMKVLVDNDLYDSKYPVGGLYSGEHNTVNFSNPWSSLIPGIHIIRLIIDSDDEIPETNENNNEATRAIIVGIAANPGFKSFIPSETLPDINEQISITAKIGNDGSQSCNTNVKFQYINNMADTVVIGETSVIVPGHDSTIVTIPWVVADTNTTLIGTIFETNVPEFNYEDNLATAGIGEGISITLSSANACQGKNNGTLTAIATGGIEPYQFNWSTGFIGDTLIAGTGAYMVTVYDNTGMSQSATGTISSYPLTIPIITGPDSLCGLPSSGNIYFTESGMADYHWTISPDGEITAGGDTGDTSVIVNWNTPGTKTVTVNYTDNNGCSAIIPTAFQTQLLLLPVPSVSGPDSICQHESGMIYATDPGMTDYLWAISPGGSIVNGQGTHSLEVDWITTGEQWVEVSYQGINCPSETKRYNVTVFTGTDPGMVTGSDTLWFGLEANLTLEGNIGDVIKWQKRENGGPWQYIMTATGTNHSEIPDTTGNWDYRAEVQNGNCSAFFSDFATVVVQPVTININLTLLLEGLYDPGTGVMDKAQDEYGDKYSGTVADKVKVRIARPMAPYSAYYAVDDIDLNQDGTASITVHRAGYYYLVVNHRNHIETWSSLPVYSLPDTTSYDFTIAASQVFGDNQREISGKWTIWGGDVNQDGIVDAGDMNPVDNATTAITFGYVNEDVNGDGIVDAGDMNIVDNNTTAIIFVISP